MELENSILTNKEPKLKYKAEIWNGEKEDIFYTDGVIFKLYGMKFDLGYNFIEKNNFIKKFRPKKEWE